MYTTTKQHISAGGKHCLGLIQKARKLQENLNTCRRMQNRQLNGFEDEPIRAINSCSKVLHARPLNQWLNEDSCGLKFIVK